MTLRLILGDQLNILHPWFKNPSPEVIYLMMEMRQETDYVKHHIQKIIAFFGAMRHFAQTIENKGHRIKYIAINSSENKPTLEENLKKQIDFFRAKRFEYMAPDEYRLDIQLKQFCTTLDLPYAMVDTDHFLTTRSVLSDFFKGKKQFVMEYFYRDMRRNLNILMLGLQPEEGQWNFDKNNRNKWTGKPSIPPHYKPQNDIHQLKQLYELITIAGVTTIGHFDEDSFSFPLSREEALKQLEYFCVYLLPHFGDFQDALHTDEVNLFHARISFALNAKIIGPLEVVEIAVEHYRKNKNQIAFSQIEGFVRQIIGWREYIRGIYWHKMPEYASLNKLNNHQPLPNFYWNGKTKMNCLHHSITNSLSHAYAHHIQRLMIIGNFSLLSQLHPDAVDGWYLGIYADAIEWVQLPNTRGMSQWADGGIVATKPYVSAAAYIHKMSNYCSKCGYDKSIRVGENACPFNALYWNFLDDKKQHFEKNNRMVMMLRLLEKISQKEMVKIKQRAAEIIQNPDAF